MKKGHFLNCCRLKPTTDVYMAEAEEMLSKEIQVFSNF
jgi:hypothetical protein